MAKVLKRRGKSFISEHYVDSEVMDMIIPIVVEHITKGRMSEYAMSRLKKYRELSVWADPRGLAFYVGHGKMPIPVPWEDLGLSDEDVMKIMMEMARVFNEHYKKTEEIPNTFKILVNDEKLQLVLDMMEI